jgi:hypothetical protein
VVLELDFGQCVAELGSSALVSEHLVQERQAQERQAQELLV